ncbi:GAF domain-containing protein [Prosthecobacter debontii]|uniref:GAF domain-containing protein n=1 Tax=Prosthecobacter debontii TaxID=48467 RepID=A0A1T4YH92_9BACT|nr:GAF domain-containing protein [Prosthecobacter debontii]SKB01073.1 GAF domain-containing protein [Prosthecobacter debontii]
MPAPYSTFPDPDLSPLAERLDSRCEEHALHALRLAPAALVEGLPARLLHQALAGVQADEGSVWLAQETPAVLVPVWNNGPDAARFVGSFRLPSTQGITGSVFTSGLAACESEVCFRQRQNRDLDRSLEVLTWAMLAVPLKFAGAVRGVITAVRLIRPRDLPGLTHVPESAADFPPGFTPPAAFSVADLAAMETTAAGVGRLIQHRLTTWVLGTEE